MRRSAPPAPGHVLGYLRLARPDLVEPYLAALPAARAAILARLWGALHREPIAPAGLRHRLTGPPEAAEPFARPESLVLHLDGASHTDPVPLLHALRLTGPAGRLASEVDNSVANLALARAAQPPPHGGPPLLPYPSDDVATEQSIVDGHPLHPCCRTRTGMSAADVLAYAPEHRSTVDIALVPVPARRALVTGEWPSWLRDGDSILLPVHPWQRAHRDLPSPTATLAGRPLMSLRTVSLLSRPWHVKTSVDSQMTSAVRGVSPAAVHNGPAWSSVLAELAGKVGGIEIMPEVAAAAVLVDGEPDRGLAAALRRAPTTGVGVPFAALSAPSPASGRALVTELVSGSPHRFLAATVSVTLPPLLTLLDLGVALEAHGQNTLLLLDGRRPSGLRYRDLGGVRLCPARLRAAGVEPPPIHGDIATDDPAELRTKLLAALMSTVVSELVATLAREYGEQPARLWRTVATAARACGGSLTPGARDLLDSLFTGPWPIKATTAMRLAADPLDDIWADIPNPLESNS